MRRNPTGELSRGARWFAAAQQPTLVSTNQLAAIVEADADFLRLAEIYSGGPGFSVSKLIRELVESESVQFLPFQRYKESGLRKRQERWTIYPGAERDGDPSPMIAWAGWNHLQQAQALAAYYIDASQNQGWPAEKLRPLLAGLADLLPWLKQWHNQFNPDYASGLGDYFAGFLDEEARKQGTTTEALNSFRFGNVG